MQNQVVTKINATDCLCLLPEQAPIDTVCLLLEQALTGTFCLAINGSFQAPKLEGVRLCVSSIFFQRSFYS